MGTRTLCTIPRESLPHDYGGMNQVRGRPFCMSILPAMEWLVPRVNFPVSEPYKKSLWTWYCIALRRWFFQVTFGGLPFARILVYAAIAEYNRILNVLSGP